MGTILPVLGITATMALVLGTSGLKRWVTLVTLPALTLGLCFAGALGSHDILARLHPATYKGLPARPGFAASPPVNARGGNAGQ